MNEADRVKSNVRRLTNYYQKQGRIVPQPCQRCGDPNAEKHHHDYGKPLEVEWLCRTCHRAEHPRPYDGNVKGYEIGQAGETGPYAKRRAERREWHLKRMADTVLDTVAAKNPYRPGSSVDRAAPS